MGLFKKLIDSVLQSTKVVKQPQSKKEVEKLNSYIAVPAPDILPYDPWFDPPIKTEKQIMIEKKKLEAKKQQEEVEAAMTQSKEPKNIHDVLYKKAAAHMKNSWQENLGGSENFHQGPGGWTSGTGINQFR